MIDCLNRASAPATESAFMAQTVPSAPTAQHGKWIYTGSAVRSQDLVSSLWEMQFDRIVPGTPFITANKTWSEL